jgi:predicted amidohydrolase YtcJ
LKTLFVNGKVWQPDGTFDEAFGINKGHFDFTGTNDGANKVTSGYDEVIDLKGRLVLPGFTDGHLHLCYGSLMRKRLDCRNIKNPEELKEIIHTYENNNETAQWIIGSNLDMPLVLANLPKTPGNFVDELFLKKPLFIANYDYHSALCNSLAFEKSGLLNKLNDFSKDNIPLDLGNNPIGIVKEEALDYVFEHLPDPSLNEKCSAVKEFIKILHSCGITTVSDITLPADLDVYKSLYEHDELNIRINSYIPFEEFPNIKKHEEYTKEINRDYFSIKGFKAFYDGALGSATALFSENYRGTKQNGIRTEQAESGELKKLAAKIDKAKRQMIIHAIGDLAVSEVLDICEELNKLNGKYDRRLRIEHAQHIKENDFDRFKELDVIVSAQPVHLKYDMKLVEARLPDSLIKTTHNYMCLIDKGVIVNFGTDFPIVDVNPFENIQMAVTRKTAEKVFTPEYKIPLHECIKAYTINNAYSNFNDKAAGTIETGKAADFVIMEDDLFEMNEDEIANARVFKTYLNGKEVYSL